MTSISTHNWQGQLIIYGFLAKPRADKEASKLTLLFVCKRHKLPLTHIPFPIADLLEEDLHLSKHIGRSSRELPN